MRSPGWCPSEPRSRSDTRTLPLLALCREIRTLQAQDAVDLPKMVQVVCRFQADELLDRLPSAYLVDPVELHPPCARDRLQQSQVALAQRPKDPRRKARLLLRVTQALCPYGLIPPRQGHARIRQHVSQSPSHRQLRIRQVRYDLGD